MGQECTSQGKVPEIRQENTVARRPKIRPNNSKQPLKSMFIVGKKMVAQKLQNLATKSCRKEPEKIIAILY
jgi:CO dehydrogenase/acetyl-CoA synthase epsilon subunit